MKQSGTLDSFKVGLLDVNCYFVFIPQSETLYIIDPGSDADRVIEKANTYPHKQIFILLTHAHVDHISAVGAVSKKFDATVMLNSKELPLYNSPDNHIRPYVPPANDLPKTVDTIESDDFEIIETPGHTVGGRCFYFKELPALISGDTLFLSSIGRTDLPGGDTAVLLNSIKKGLFTLPNELKVYPGHGDSTTIGYEKTTNPYFPK